MTEDKYYIKISPENIFSDLATVPYTAATYTITGISGNCCFIAIVPIGTEVDSGTTVVRLPMKTVVSSGPNGRSIMTGLTIPILFRQTAVDMGYYSVFDGAILQKDVVTNFVFKQNINNPRQVEVYNTSEKEFKNFLNLSQYQVDWGNGVIQPLVSSAITYNYITDGFYDITLKQTNPWGINTIKKKIKIPFTGTTISNPKGEAFFTPMVGQWSSTSISYDFIFSGDAVNLISEQTSDNYIGIPFVISGYTISRLEELRQYGPQSFIPNKWVEKPDNKFWGKIDQILPSSTGYTIEGVKYVDFDSNTTVYFFNSSGFTSNWMVQSAITKNEEFLNIVFDPEVQSDIYIERGKNSALERVERLGEVDTIGDLENYGYKFFKFKSQ
jgi:hypothetical protein